MFFYAGHGLQVRGQNYLLTIDAKLKAATAFDFEMVRLDLVQRSMERRANTNILLQRADRSKPLETFGPDLMISVPSARKRPLDERVV